jgi:integrase
VAAAWRSAGSRRPAATSGRPSRGSATWSRAKTPYDLRHAAVSTWLNGGVPPTTAAEWAGHSVEVLLRTYAKCPDGSDALVRRRVEAALGYTDTNTATDAGT